MNILTVNLLFSTLVFWIAARLYLLPRLHELRPRSVLLPILLLHAFRHLGLMFLAPGATYAGIPPQFAYPAAWGDIAVGVTAPVAMWAAWFRESEIRRRGSRWQRVWIAWNVFGLADHIIAVTVGTLCFPGVTNVFAGPPDTAMFAQLPMLLFPLYMVPFADTLHLLMIDLVRRPQEAVSGARDRVKRDAVAVGGRA